MNITPSFFDINFRYTDARNERLYTPEVLLNAFVDVQYWVKQLYSPDKYIVYGPKGSGKTAIGSHIELNAMTETDLFARVDDLENFDFSLVARNDSDEYPKTTGAWKFLLVLRLFALLAEDIGLREINPSLDQLVIDLDSRGLIPSTSLSKLAENTLEKGTEIGLKFLIEVQAKFSGQKEYVLKTPSQIGDGLLEYLHEMNGTESRYILFVDGLDHVLRHGKKYISTLSDLINATRIINEEIINSSINAKIVLLIRDEVARAIPNPDLTKRLTDNGILLDWYRNINYPFSTDLLKVIERRAFLAGFSGNIQNLWRGWLPSRVFKRPTSTYILLLTRYLPRDLIYFFRCLQQIGSEPPFGGRAVEAATQVYSQWYYEELSDALVGLVDEKVISSLSGIFRQLGRYFSVSNLNASLEQRNLSEFISGEQLAHLLFETHWLGNYHTSPQGQSFYTFRSRSRSVGFSSELECVLTPGLVPGLNLNWRRDQQI